MINKSKNSFLTSASNPAKSLAKGFGFLSLSLFTLFLISGCPETVRTVTGPTVTNIPPSLVSNQAVAFTYNSDASFPLYNRGGVVENCRLFTNGVDATNVLPMGLTVTASNGLCVIEGMSSHLTLTANYTTIDSVPVVVEASNGDGVSRAQVGVSVEPRYWSGDLSYGLIHDGHPLPADHEIAGIFGIFYSNGQDLVYKADAIPFASGGTGAYDDPVIIGIDANTGNFSIVLDFDEVEVPVDNFSNRTNVVEQNFHINFLLKNRVSNRIVNQGNKLMKQITNGGLLFTYDVVFAETLMSKRMTSDGFQMSNPSGITTTSAGALDILPFINCQYTSTLAPSMVGVLRVSFDFFIER